MPRIKSILVVSGLTAVLSLPSPAWAQLGAPITAPAPLNANAATDTEGDWGTQVVTDGAGHWVTVWYSGDDLGGTIGLDYDILVSCSADHGVSWSTTAALNSNAGSDTGADMYPQVATDALGNWVAVWWSDENLGGSVGTDSDIFVARSVDHGATWSVPQALNTNADSDSGQDSYPQIIANGSGTWLAVWHSIDNLGGTIGTDADILVARSTDNGATWSTPQPLNTNAASDSGADGKPQVTTDGLGNWLTVWYSSENLGGTIGTDRDILMARSTDNGSTWSAPQVLNTNADSDSGDDMYPQAATDSLGHWITVWRSDENVGGVIGTDDDILVARSTDNGETWSAPGPLNNNASSDTGDDYEPRVATDGAGNWVTVWSSKDDLGGTIASDYDNLVARSADNAATWSDPQPLNTNATSDSGDDEYPHLATDGSGTWVVVWESDDDLGATVGGDYDILLARFALPDCNANGVADGQDIAGATSSDCDGNGVPDECQPDSDGDGTIDVCEGPCGCGATTAVLMSFWALCVAKLPRRRRDDVRATRR
ncbi:MAG: exo-alpha-sialidase [Phycisphaerales bacterium]|nr:MAG: exo-alpha-sialidase [Phycisphaerales bacterium]